MFIDMVLPPFGGQSKLGDNLYTQKDISMKKNIHSEEFKIEAVRLVCDALQMALWRRGFPKGVIVHTDRGSQYCSKKYQQLLKDNQLICSMSGKGCCYDNAVSETFFHTLKEECLFDFSFANREDAKQTIFEYIEIYYNRNRKHSTIGYNTPAQFELLTGKIS